MNNKWVSQEERTIQIFDVTFGDSSISVPSILQTHKKMKAVEKQRPLSLRRNFTWTFLGNVVYAGCQWGMLMALAKLGSPEMVGQFALALAIAAPVMEFSNLQLRVVQATDARHTFLFGNYLGLRLITITIAVTVIILFGFTGGYGMETALVIASVSVFKALEGVADITYGFLQQHERMDRIARSLMIKGPMILLTMSVGVYFYGDISRPMWGVAGIVMLILVMHDFPGVIWAGGGAMGLIFPSWNIAALSKLTRLSLPLGVAITFSTLNINSPRYFIEHYFGERELGLFMAMVYIGVAGRTLNWALLNSSIPRLSQLYAKKRISEFCLLLLKLATICVLLGLLIVLVSLAASPTILTVLYTSEYVEHATLLPLVMLVTAIRFLENLLSSAVKAIHYFKLLLPVYIGSLVLFIGLCLYWIQDFGLCGVICSMVASACFEVAILGFILAHLLRRASEPGNFT